MRSPLVIAMWKRLADAYGYPKRKLGYEPLEAAFHRRLSRGRLAAVRAVQVRATNPDSNLGPSAVAASYYAAVDVNVSVLL